MARRRRRSPTNGPLLDDDGCFRVQWWPARWRNRKRGVTLLEVEEVDAMLRRILSRDTSWSIYRTSGGRLVLQIRDEALPPASVEKVEWWLTPDAVTGHGFLHVALRGEDEAWSREFLLVFCFLTPLALERVRWLVERTVGSGGRLGERNAEIHLWVSPWDTPPLEAGGEVALVPGRVLPVRSRLRTFVLQYVMSCLLPLGLPGRPPPWASRWCPECRAAYGPELEEPVVGGG